MPISSINNITNIKNTKTTLKNNKQQQTPSFKGNIEDSFESTFGAWKLKNSDNKFVVSIPKKDYPNINKMSENIINKNIKPCFEDFIYDFVGKLICERGGTYMDIPNCIMVHDPSGKVGDDLVKFAKEFTEEYAHFKYLPATPTIPDALRGLHSALKESEENFKKTGKRTLIHLEDFEKLVLKETEFRTTEWMKAKTTACAEDYHATIIFKTKDPYKFVEEIIEPHRVGLWLKTNLPNVPDAPVKIAQTEKEAIKETGKKVEQAVNEVKEQVSETAKNTVESAKEKAENVVKKTVETAKEKVETVVKNTGKTKPLKKAKNKLLLFLGALLTGAVVCKDKIVECWNKLTVQKNKNVKS